MHDTHGPDALFVDLYEMTMAQAYLQSGQSGQATFSLYFRNFPSDRAYYVFCGLESAVGYLESLSFSEMDIDTLERMGLFDDALLEYLRSFRFSGSVRAMAEGEVFFPNEPVLEVTGPIIECQIAETFLLNQINLESMLATKAARVVDAAAGRSVVDFGARRTHGLDAATKFARASYIVGFDGTSNVRAASMYGIPAVGTMAHSYISSFDSELDAFASYAKSFPETSTFSGRYLRDDRRRPERDRGRAGDGGERPKSEGRAAGQRGHRYTGGAGPRNAGRSRPGACSDPGQWRVGRILHRRPGTCGSATGRIRRWYPCRNIR